MNRSISWKKAGVVVVLLHIGAAGSLIAINKIKSSIHRTQRDKEKQQLLASTNSSSMWPERKDKPKIVAYPKEVSKKITDTVSNKSFQDYIAEKSASFLIARENTKKYFEDVYADLEKIFVTTEKEVTQAKKQTVKAIEKKVAQKSGLPVTVMIGRQYGKNS